MSRLRDGRTSLRRCAHSLFPSAYERAELILLSPFSRLDSQVHGEKSFLIMQLWALGRAADPKVLKSELPDADIVSASDIPFEGGATPRPLTKEEIKEYVAAYAKGAKRFVEEAGGDAVELHSANGALLSLFSPLSLDAHSSFSLQVTSLTSFLCAISPRFVCECLALTALLTAAIRLEQPHRRVRRIRREPRPLPP
jgi:hypothetical protein